MCIVLLSIPVKRQTDCPEGMRFFLARVEQGKDTVCASLRVSAVNIDLP